jgi:hypothetical protein
MSETKEKRSTLNEILRSGYPTLAQYEIMKRADQMFQAGRFFNGPLTEEEVHKLTEGVKK